MKKINEIDTSSTTSAGSTMDTLSTTKPNPNGNVTVDAKSLKKPDVVKAVDSLEKNKISVNVVEESTEKGPDKLEYLSEIKDGTSGEMSKPFSINGKQYQMVRAINSKKEKVVGVYSMDEVDEGGNNIIYDVDDFEKNIASKHINGETSEKDEVKEDGESSEVAPEAETAPEPKETEDEGQDEGRPSFAGFKHFIVNKRTNKSRKFKGLEELAKAQMSEDEIYMGIKDFKKYVDAQLFGGSKKQQQPVMNEEDNVTGSETDMEMNVKAKKLMDLIKKKIPETIIKTIVTPVAQREVIAAFAEMIGVPRNGLNTLIAGLKDLSKADTETTAMSTSSTSVSETRIIKVKDLL